MRSVDSARAAVERARARMAAVERGERPHWDREGARKALKQAQSKLRSLTG